MEAGGGADEVVNDVKKSVLGQMRCHGQAA